MSTIVLYGLGIDGRKYGFKVADTAYPTAIRSDCGFTAVTGTGTVPSDVLFLPDNQVKGVFCRLYARCANGNKALFVAANKAGSANALVGKTVGTYGKVQAVRFTG